MLILSDVIFQVVGSASLGYPDWYTPEQIDGNTAVTTKGVNIAVSQKGMVMVISAGNEGFSGIAPPGDSPYAITVGAVDEWGAVPGFSSRGPTYDGVTKPEVVALGVNAWCADFSAADQFYDLSGTSTSTPLVAGAVAQLLSVHPLWTVDQIRQALLTTASNADNPNNDIGWGIINVVAANQSSPQSTLTKLLTSKVCPNDCSGNGVCIDFACVCNIDYFSFDCSMLKSICPKQCVHGYCTEANCTCFEGFVGPFCNSTLTVSGMISLIVTVLQVTPKM